MEFCIVFLVSVLHPALTFMLNKKQLPPMTSKRNYLVKLLTVYWRFISIDRLNLGNAHFMINEPSKTHFVYQKVIEDDQEIPQLHTADQPTAP